MYYWRAMGMFAVARGDAEEAKLAIEGSNGRARTGGTTSMTSHVDAGTMLIHCLKTDHECLDKRHGCVLHSICRYSKPLSVALLIFHPNAALKP